MGLFEQFPYTNFHGYNLDFILKKLKRLEGKMEALEGKMAALEGRMSDLEDEMLMLKNEMAALTEMVRSYENRISALETLTAEHSQQIENINNNIDDIAERLESVENDIDSIISRLDSAESNITNLQVRMSEAETDIANLESAISTISNSITDIVNNMESMGADIEALTSKVTALENDGKVIDLSGNFIQDGSLDMFRRSVYQINGIVFGTMRLQGYTDTGREIEITVNGLSAPAYGSFTSYRENPVGTTDYSHLIDSGYISSYAPARNNDDKNGRLETKPANFITPIHKKSGDGYLMRVPNNVRRELLDNTDCSCLIQFTYVAENRI